MACERWREMLSAQLDGEDDADERELVEQHLAGCADCRAWLDRAATVNRLTRTGPATPVPDLSATIMAAVAAETGGHRPAAPGDAALGRAATGDTALHDATVGGAAPGHRASGGAALRGATPGHAARGDAALRDATVRHAALHDAALHDAILRDAALRDAALHDATLHDATLHDATLHDAAMRDAAMRHATRRDATLGHAALGHAALGHAALGDAAAGEEAAEPAPGWIRRLVGRSTRWGRRLVGHGGPVSAAAAWLTRPRLTALLYLALAAVGAVQLILGLNQVGGGATGTQVHVGLTATPGHLWHESAAWNVSVGAGYLFIALRRSRPTGLVPMLTAFVGMLLLLSLGDLSAARVDSARLVSHGFVIVGYLLIVVLSKVNRETADPPGARAGDGPGSSWRAHFADEDAEVAPPPPALRLVPRHPGPLTAGHDERRAA